MTMDKHLTCDSCGGTIDSLSSALVEWAVIDNGADRFKIIHNIKSSPRGREACSFHVFAGHDHLIQDIPGTEFLDPGKRTTALSGRVNDQAAITGVTRKLACAGLDSPETSLRQTAILALARMGDEALPVAEDLSAVLADEDEDVRFKAAFILKVLGASQYRSKADTVIGELARPMEMVDCLEPFVGDSPLMRGIITGSTGLIGEVIEDVTGKMFLAPEEDYRGGGMGSVPLFGYRGPAGELLKVTGVFDRDLGIWAESATTEGG